MMQLGTGAQFHFINGEVIGVSFGSDNTSEHECGINPLMEQLGLAAAGSFAARTDFQKWNQEKQQKTVKGFARRLFRIDPPIPAMGLEKRRITKTPSFLRWVEKDGCAGFICYFREFAIDSSVSKFTHYFRPDRDLVCGWCSDGFIALAKTLHDQNLLRVVFNAMQRKNAVLGSFPEPKHRGLAILIASKVPPAFDEKLLDEDMKLFTMEKMVDETGIVEQVKASGKEFSSLHKGILDDKGVLRIWLNPREQQAYNYGWFTVEELQQWCQDKGPIMKSTKQSKR